MISQHTGFTRLVLAASKLKKEECVVLIVEHYQSKKVKKVINYRK